MIVECINNDYIEDDITVGDTYQILKTYEHDLVVIVNDMGLKVAYPKKYFKEI